MLPRAPARVDLSVFRNLSSTHLLFRIAKVIPFHILTLQMLINSSKKKKSLFFGVAILRTLAESCGAKFGSHTRSQQNTAYIRGPRPLVAHCITPTWPEKWLDGAPREFSILRTVSTTSKHSRRSRNVRWGVWIGGVSLSNIRDERHWGQMSHWILN
jgi:hypothetical protein